MKRTSATEMKPEVIFEGNVLSVNSVIEPLTDPSSGSYSRGKSVSGIICLRVDDLFCVGDDDVLPEGCHNSQEGFPGWLGRYIRPHVRRSASVVGQGKVRIILCALTGRAPLNN